MSLSHALPVAAVDMVVMLLVRLIIPLHQVDAAAARTSALAMLAEYDPRTMMELRLAGEIIGLSLNAMQAQGDAAQPDMTMAQRSDARRWAGAFTRTGLAAQRRLEAMQKARRAGADSGTDAAAPITASPRAVAEAEPPAQQPEPAAPALVVSEAGPAGPPDHAVAALQQAEADFRKADRLLTLMRAHHKGAPPPHSQAAQQIRDQQRIVDAARMKLAQARKRHNGMAAETTREAA
ncbi:MAG: hypothetical protein U1E70_00870 [Acetobacteraceae bacterium]